MKRAIERHKQRTARVIPILLSSVDWENAPFSKLQRLPTDGKPVSEWQPRAKAYHDISEGIKRVVFAFLGIAEKSNPKQPAVRRRAQGNQRSFAAVGYRTATPRYQKRLPPMRYGPSLLLHSSLVIKYERIVQKREEQRDAQACQSASSAR
jgi:hypothetical protein